MVCEMRRTPEQIRQDAKALEEQLFKQRVKLIIGANGSVAFSGRTDDERRDLTDLCAYRRLKASGSIALRSALARAEIAAGRTVDKQVINEGLHSHDGGKTWGRHT